MGFDWLTLDIEHQAIDWSQAATLFATIADAGCVPLARVPEGSHVLIKRVLDAGAWGIVVPMVDTVEQARVAIAAAKYPPVGNRSVGGGMHSLNFAATSAEYYRRANDEILVVLQTESPTGVENAEAIYALDGVDAIFVGPVDLRANMRKRDGTEASDDEFEALLAHVVAAGKKTGTPTGMHVMNPESRLAAGRSRDAIHRRGQRAADDDRASTADGRRVGARRRQRRGKVLTVVPLKVRDLLDAAGVAARFKRRAEPNLDHPVDQLFAEHSRPRDTAR